MKQVKDVEGHDLSVLIEPIAEANGVDPIALLALVKAESGLNPYAERYGTRTQEFLQRLLWYKRGDHSQAQELQAILDDVGYDISFGLGQQIIAYHYAGDHTTTLENVLAVRKQVFDNPAENLEDAAIRLARGKVRSFDNTWLGAMVVYNAGSDKRNDDEWFARWKGNVASYQAELDWAEQYRTAPTQVGVLEHLDELWGVSNELDRLDHQSHGDRIRERVAAIKAELGL